MQHSVLDGGGGGRGFWAVVTAVHNRPPVSRSDAGGLKQTIGQLCHYMASCPYSAVTSSNSLTSPMAIIIYIYICAVAKS